MPICLILGYKMSEKKSVLRSYNPMALRDKYSADAVNKRMLNKQNNFSSFWLDDGWDNTGSIFDDEEVVKPKVDLIALASYRRAIANFVNILTKKDIPVTFKTSGDSYTDGKKVVISSKLDDKLFDSSVGLALHEGSHILLSDFDFLKQLEMNIPQEYYDRSELKGFTKQETLGYIKNLLNYVEDRRIDHYVFTTSPGYKGYYHSMYDKYFHFKAIDKGLKSSEYTEETIDSYFFRIINLTNSNTNLDALKGLRDIWKVLDLRNINRLVSTEKTFDVALEIYNIILNNIPDGIEKVDSQTGEVSYERSDGGDKSNTETTETISDDDFDKLLDSIEKGEMNISSDDSAEGDGESSGQNIEVEGGDKDSSGQNNIEVEGGDKDSKRGVKGKGSGEVRTKTKEVKLSDNQKNQLENAIKKQKKFMDGEVTKTNVTKKDKQSLDAVEEAGMEYKEVGKDLKDWEGKSTPTKVKVIVVKNLTKKLIDSDTVKMASRWNGRNYDGESYGTPDTYIEDGIRLGTILGRKLQMRGETRETKYTRKLKGRIDKRLIAELGFDNENVFSQTYVDSYPDAFLHISVDASGSMGGAKWDNTMTSVVAMAKAVDMISNVDLVITFRATENSGNRRGESYPLILVAYDSRKDSFSKIKNLFKYIGITGTTPEGLCFEAIMNDMIPGGRDRESYFLNFSDGMPMFSNNSVTYHGSIALNHTRKMVKEFRNRGIKVLSYFISGRSGYDSESSDFKIMYGSDSQHIDVTSVMAVAKTMNKKFLEK